MVLLETAKGRAVVSNGEASWLLAAAAAQGVKVLVTDLNGTDGPLRGRRVA